MPNAYIEARPKGRPEGDLPSKIMLSRTTPIMFSAPSRHNGKP